MFNVTGGELVIILVIALVILGPERLPGAARTVGKIMGQVREVSNGFQKELKSALDEVAEPVQAMVKPQLTALDGGALPDLTDKAKSAEMAPVQPGGVAPVDPDPVAGWATPPRPVLPDTPPTAIVGEHTSAGSAGVADAGGALPPLAPPDAGAANAS